MPIIFTPNIYSEKKMSKFKVTIKKEQSIIVEAKDNKEALVIADMESNDDDWEDEYVIFPLHVELYNGPLDAFNPDYPNERQ